MNKVCDTGGICGHIPQCQHFCHFTNAENEPEVILKGEARLENTVITQPELTRKVKPWPVVPDDIAPVPEAWQIVGSVLVGFVLVALVVIAALFFLTGLYIWSLLI
jgi:hypothetical protein